MPISEYKETFDLALAESSKIMTYPSSILDCVSTQCLTEPDFREISRMKVKHNWSSNRVLPNFDHSFTSHDLAWIRIAPLVEEVLWCLNHEINYLLTPEQFDRFPVIQGSLNTLTKAKISKATENLDSLGVPTDDRYLVVDAEINKNLIESPDRAKLVVNKTLPPRQGHTSILMDPRAIELLTVNSEIQNDESTYEAILFPKPNVAVLIQFWLEPESGTLVIRSFCRCGYQVVNPNFGSLIIS